MKQLVSEAVRIYQNTQNTSDENIVKLIRQLLQDIKWEEPFAFLEFGGPEFNATEWWSKASSFADILSPLAVRLFTIKPHAAGPERVFSLFDWVQSKRRNRLHMSKIESATVVSMYFKNQQAPKRATKRKFVDLSEEQPILELDQEDEVELQPEALENMLEQVWEDEQKIKRKVAKKRSTQIDESKEDDKWDEKWLDMNTYSFLYFKMVDYNHFVFSKDYDPVLVVKGKERVVAYTSASRPIDINALIDSEFNAQKI